MNHYTSSELAEIRRQELTANAAYYRQIRRHGTQRTNRRRNPLTAVHAWVAAGQL
jgi:hypothetical protein